MYLKIAHKKIRLKVKLLYINLTIVIQLQRYIIFANVPVLSTNGDVS